MMEGGEQDPATLRLWADGLKDAESRKEDDNLRLLQITDEQIDAVLSERKLLNFAKLFWSVFESCPFADGWHIEAICEHLEAVTRGEISSLVINIPPRHSKSLLTSVFWPAWMWATRPEVKVVTSSYSSDLAIRDAIKQRRIIKTDLFQETWWSPAAQGDERGVYIHGDQDRSTLFANNRGGHRFATAVGSRATGFGGDIILCDDPHNVRDARLSPASRREAILWWTESMSTRINFSSTIGAEVIIAQRVHEEDLCGYVLKEYGDMVVHLCLPARFENRYFIIDDEKRERWVTGKKKTALGFEDPRTEVGELLWPNLVTEPKLKRIEKKLGSYGIAGQLQQRPAPAEGGMLKKAWWRHYRQSELPEKFDEVIQAWDFSNGSIDLTASFTTCFVMGRKGANIWFLHRWRKQCEVPEAVKAMFDISKKFPKARKKVIENAAAGKPVLQMLRGQLSGMIPFPHTGSKESKAAAWSPVLESRNLYIPEDEEWGDVDLVDSLPGECAVFPNGAFDDQVDCAGIGVRYLTDRIGLSYDLSPGALTGLGQVNPFSGV